MSSEIAVSVVIPAYNAEKYIEQCINSILKQTLKNIEIICVDDGSTDKSLKKLESLQKKDDRLKIISQENINAGAARNRGLKEVSGKYVIFMDADDFFEAEMLEKMYKRAEEVGAEVVVSDSDVYLEDKKTFIEGWAIRKELVPKRKVFSSNEIERIFYAFIGWPWDKLFLTSFIRDNKLKFQEQKSTNDLYFVYAALVRADKISVIYDVLAHHRHNVKTSISANRENSWWCAHDALIKLKNQLKTWNCFSGKVERCYVNYCLNHFIWHFNTLKYPANKECYEAFREKWIKEYGLNEKGREYFYNHDEYEHLCMYKKFSYGEFLTVRVFELEEKLEDTYNRYRKNEEVLIKDINELKQQIKNINKHNEELRKQVEDLSSSTSMKVGLLATWAPRKLKDLVKKINL